LTPSKKRLFLHEYHLIHARVDEGELTKDEIDTQLLKVMIRMGGVSSRLYMKQEMMEAVVHREAYSSEAYEDWRLQFNSV